MNNIKVVTAAALFDGHDVSINIFRRLLQRRGAEVIHLGHNRSVKEVITVALQEDADAILVSSYQGGHNEYFRFMVDSLKKHDASHKLIFGGGGGVILPSEIEALEEYGVTRIYHATDGQKVGIDGIADDIMHRISKQKKLLEKSHFPPLTEETIRQNLPEIHYGIAKQITFVENNINNDEYINKFRELYKKHDKGHSLVIGVTGTGGSGKSSLIDEIIGRFISMTDSLSIGILAVDPSKSKTGGALLGDRIRYNQIYNNHVYFRSFATRQSTNELSTAVRDSISVLKSCGFDLIFVETSGIGQGDSRVAEVSDYSMYVMTAEFGAPSQLEKIDMLDIADFIVINKFEKLGSEDALREVIINYIRTHQLKVQHTMPLEELNVPVYAASSSQFNNHGINRLFKDILRLMLQRNQPRLVEQESGVNRLESGMGDVKTIQTKISTGNGTDGIEKDDSRYSGINFQLIDRLPVHLDRDFGLIDNKRINYLADIADTIKRYRDFAAAQADIAGKTYALKESIGQIEDSAAIAVLKQKFETNWDMLSEDTKAMLSGWDEKRKSYQKDEIKYNIQGRDMTISGFVKSLSGSKIPKVALPKHESWQELVKFFYKENLPGEFPYTAGVFPFRRTTEDPKRQFAGEGGPSRTNRRFHYLCRDDAAKRLSVAFDGITLYGEDPAVEPDVYGKIGESGVSICTIDDMDSLLKGFDLTDPLTSVSMTINAPAPIMVAFYFVTAYRRELEKIESRGETLTEDQKEQLRIKTFHKLRGTVQADMLKEDQGQNTCIFSIDFAMKLIGDLQEYLSKHDIKNYYSLSISGYHIAEAGANPITQLAFTLANGFTYVEYFLNRGLKIDDFAPNLSFFFSNGMDPEYSVIGRVARRIWAIAMKHRYGASEKSQKLKYHIQTSGRSLHAQEIDFNDIRTTLQGLIAYNDNCNSLHTNSYDEAVTTPTEESVRRSIAIQMILSNEFGLLKNENPNQGSYVIEELTDMVEDAVLEEFNAISRRGGVLGAMEHQYQRSKIQEQSLYYESLKQTGEYPIIGVNKFLRQNGENPYDKMLITRATADEKEERLADLYTFREKQEGLADQALNRLREVALTRGNIFEELLHTVEHATMGQITNVLYEIGGKYRRGM